MKNINPTQNMSRLKRIFKKNTHNTFFKILAGLGRSLNRLYENRNHDVHSNGELTVLKKLSSIKPTVIFDGGANVGNYCFLANEIMPECTIYAFEPVDATYQQLLKNIHNIQHIVPVKKGLFKENCASVINLFNSDEHSSLYDIQGLKTVSNQTQQIELICGDDFMKENNITSIDLLKLDVEGAEFDALIGFKNAIRKGSIKMVQFEYGYINISTKNLLLDFYNFFEENGYIVGKVFPKLVEFRSYAFKFEDFIGPNFIAVKKTEVELVNLLSKK
jgi:FkbM family methyltransferase